MKPYGNDDGKTPELYLAKARTLSAPVPLDSVPVPSDPAANARFFGQFGSLVERAAEALETRPRPGYLKKTSATKDFVSVAEPSGLETLTQSMDSKAAPANDGLDDEFEPGVGA